jgi:DNA-binding response OmpR family regulator
VTTPASAAGRTVSVLIIEDDADTANSLAHFLRLGCGYAVGTALDGLTGIRMAVAGQPDVVICEIGLSKRNGLLVAEELAESLPYRPLLIAVTGYGEQVSKGLAEAAGFDHYLLKPADPFRIEALIEAHLQNSGCSKDGEPVTSLRQELAPAGIAPAMGAEAAAQLPTSVALSSTMPPTP